jgi:uncharacterized protein YcaQ
LFLERQHLGRPREKPLTPGRLVRLAEDVGGLQLDSINVVDRAHYLTLWSRFGAYDRARVDRLVYRRRVLFEYWAHAACLVPRSHLGSWRRAMLDYELRHTGWTSWLRKNDKVVARVTEAIRAGGPMRNADFEGRRPGGASGWWSWKPVQHALHYLWMTGVLTVDDRRHFQKRFDLLERALPEVASLEAPTPEAFARWHVERSLHAMGAATDNDLRGYLTYPRFAPGVRRAALRALVAEGDVVEVAFEGTPGRWYVLARDLKALRRAARAAETARGTTFLAPFDSLLWYRERASRIFGFDYRIEVYTPQPQRVHGYYTLPILHDGRLVGRVDAKAHRAERRLELRSVHFEAWVRRGEPSPPDGGAPVDEGALAAGIAEAAFSLGQFLEADRVELGRVVPRRFRPALVRALASLRKA